MNRPPAEPIVPSERFADIELSLIRQINALATSESINLGIGEPNLEPDDTLIEFARLAAVDSWHYSANRGTPALRRRLQDLTGYHADREICVTAGTQEAIFAIIQAYVNPGDEVLIPDPGFLSYKTLVRVAGGIPVTYTLEPPEWRVEASSITSKITKRTKIIIINSPSNPLGTIIDQATMEALAHAGPIVVSDEVYHDIWYGETEPPSLAHLSDRAIVVNGMSKSHGMTGLRLGWVLAPEWLMQPIVTAHQYIATCASVFSQSLAERVLGVPEWNGSWLASVRAQMKAQREICTAAVAAELEVTVPSPAGAFYLFAPIPSCDTLTLCKRMATEARVLLIPGVAFGYAGEGFVRISYAASGQQIRTGLQRAGSYLRAQESRG